MMNSVQIDFEVHWTLKMDILYGSHTHDLLKTTKKIPYRLYLLKEGQRELLAERDFNLRDRYFIREQHFFSMDSGQYTISIEEPIGLIDIDIKHFKLNGVVQPSLVWTMP
jgi:hypothetical protein